MFEAYQTLITGLLGFLGVILTLFLNGKIQRGIRKKEIERKANSIRTAIKAELVMNKNSYELRIEQFKKDTEIRNALVPNTIFDDVYQKLLDQIGVLREVEIEKILHAYLLMAELPYKLRILVGTNSVGGVENEWIRLNHDKYADAKKIHETFLPIIQKAIDAIDKELTKKT